MCAKGGRAQSQGDYGEGSWAMCTGDAHAGRTRKHAKWKALPFPDFRLLFEPGTLCSLTLLMRAVRHMSDTRGSS